MPNYFANGNRFRPHSNETGLPIIDSITGVLDSFISRSGNNPSGYWFIARVVCGDETFNVFFDPENVNNDDIQRFEFLQTKRIRLSCKNGMPFFNEESVDSEWAIRAELLKGVTAGTIKMEDLQALVEFAKGNDMLNEKWQLFKKKTEEEGLEKVKEEMDKEVEKEQAAIEQKTALRNYLRGVYKDVLNEVNETLRKLNSALIFLQGEDYLQGTKATISYSSLSNNLVPIYDGYNHLLDAFEKFRTRKGVFVICGNTIHKIHHAFLEDKGRAFLLGSSQEFLRSKPEKVKEIIDEVYRQL